MQHRNTHKTSKTLTKQLTGRGGLRGKDGVKWARGEGVFIGPESSERPILVLYVRCYCTAVQRLSRTSRY